MISEDHYLRAKSFLSVYKEALDTLKDSAVKVGHDNHVGKFQQILQSSTENKGLVIDADGNLAKGPAIRASYWYRLDDLSRLWVVNKIENFAGGYSELVQKLEGISKSLDSEINSLTSKQK